MKKFALYCTAILFPWVAFLWLEKPMFALVAFALQITIIGWIPAAIWAYSAIKKTFPHSKKAKAIHE